LTRTIEIELNKFPQTPLALLDSTTKAAVGQVTLVVKKLFHHYFLAKYPDSAEDTGIYEYEGQITSGPDWRFKGGGIGADKESKRNVSNELGKAFARWFLYQHLGFTYFTPLDDLLNRPNTDGSKWTRHSKGDLPDYVCGKDAKDVNLLEAKGRYSSVSFRTKDFQSFRDQVQQRGRAARQRPSRGHVAALEAFDEGLGHAVALGRVGRRGAHFETDFGSKSSRLVGRVDCQTATRWARCRDNPMGAPDREG